MAKFLNLLKAMGFGTAADAAVQVGVSTDAQPRLQIDAGGKHTWGAGGVSAGDTTLYRSAADTLKTDDTFIAAGGLTVKTIEIDPASATSGQVLTYNGTKFAPASASGGAVISDTPPASPSAGQLWFESDTAKTFVYYDSTWVEIGGGGGGGGGSSVTVSDTAPASPAEGDLWFESDTGITFIYYDSVWIEVGATGPMGPTGATGPTGPTGPEGGTSTLTTKGDLLTRSSSAVARLGVGTNRQLLVADSTTATGLAWSDRPWNTAWGFVAQVTLATSIGYTTTTGDILSLTFTSVANRRYRYMATGLLVNNSSGVIHSAFCDASNNILREYYGYFSASSSNYTTGMFDYTETILTSGSVTRKIRHQGDSPTGTYYYGLDTRDAIAWKIRVEDIGPA